MIEKKLKHSAEKITMPNELKERILEKCDSTETVKNEADEEITFTVEPFRPHRIRRIVSVAAAAAVITGIAGYSGYLISRNGSFSGTEFTESITEETTEPPAESPVSVAPFGDISGMKVTEHGNPLSDEKVQQLAEFFNNYTWHEIESDVHYQIAPKVIFSFVIDDGFTTTGITVSNYGRLNFQNCNDGGDYALDSTFVDTVNEILYGTKNVENLSPFDNFVIREYLFDGESLPSEKQIKIAEFFDSQVWYPLDTLRDDYMGGIAYNFSGKDCITIYREGILEYNDENGNVSQYEIDFDLFNLNIGSILYGDEFADSEAPLSELDGKAMIFSGFRNFVPSSELDETKSQQMSDFFRSIHWQEIESPITKDRFYPGIDSIIFSTYEGKSTYRLTFSMNGTNLATYTVYDKIPAGDDDPTDINMIERTKYFAIDENVIREAVAMYLADGGNLYAPFGTLYKMTDSIYCESETYTGSLTEDKIKGISYAFLGWDWSDASYTIIEGTPEYTFSADDFKIYVYADGTVVWDGKESHDKSSVYCCYNNIDGNDDPNETTGDLCLMINDVLMEYIKVS
ncbi:MAG: hypothetical protein K2J47_11310 [Ruminococcus sp.]|nr:hypothetical protein [Ruminococcus sp.]